MNVALASMVLIPLGGAALCSVSGRALTSWLAAITGLGTLLSAITVTRAVSARGVLRHAAGGWGSSLGIELRADGVSAVMLLTVAVVGSLATVGELGRRTRDRAFFSLWLSAWAGLNALLLSADIFNLYVTLELTMLAAVGLVALRDDREGLGAALRYLLFALPGSLVYLLGVAILYGAYATLDLDVLRMRVEPEPTTVAALALMIVGLALKSAIFPMHGWMPPAYVHSPDTVSALLAGLISKGSFYVLFRVWTAAMPPGLAPSAGRVLGLLGGAAIVWGAILALRQSRLKPLIAYSSVGQTGYLFLAFALGADPAWSGAIYLALSHAAATSSMFLAAGTIRSAIGGDDLVRLRGLARNLPVTFFSLAIAGMSLMGMPPSGGFVAKWLLVRSSLDGGHLWLAAVLIVGGPLAAGYMFKVLRCAFLPALEDTPFARPTRGAELIPLALSLLALVLGLLPRPLLELLEVGRAR
jgi:formate hydrogenlyase subunit 3/multisubunit Na+/H+ antiporter MnhD subunit